MSLPKPPPRGSDLPCSDGEPLETQRHVEAMNLLVHSLRHAWRDRHDAFVAGNMFVYYSETQSRRYDFRGPDVFVVLDTDDRERRSWVVWEENGRTPDVVIEITSESTEQVDRGPKMQVYARLLHVLTYVIYDPFTGHVDVYRLDTANRAFVPIERDEHGRWPAHPLGLSLGVLGGTYAGIHAPWLRWFDAEGHVLPHEEERSAEAHARAANAEDRATAAEEEVARLREELRRRGP